MKVNEVLKKLESLRNPKNILGMKRFAIPGDYGVTSVQLREIAKETGKDHSLALELWKTGKHEARILAALIDVPSLVTEKQMENWANDFDSWDVTDNTCMHLFRKTPYAYNKINEWSKRPEEFVKRSAFTLIASLATHDKTSGDDVFIKLLDLIKKESTDERNFVRKAVNWALRGIGKKNKNLNLRAINLAKELISSGNKTAKWIGSDALRELTNTKIKARLRN